MSPNIIHIENSHWRVGFAPSAGGCVVSGQVMHDGAWVDVLRPTPEEHLTSPADTASYPLAPWSNRVRDGKLLWMSREWQLRVTAGDGTAIHGAATEYPWTVVSHLDDALILEFASRDFYGVNFPWTFTVQIAYKLDGPRLTWSMSLTNTDHETFPAGLGHHPYFVRALAPGAADANLQIDCAQGYALVDAMATGEASDVPSHADYRSLRPIGHTFVDDCLTGRTGPLAATIEYPSALAIDIEADELLSHVVVYVPTGEDFFAVEPVTNANDAFTLHAQGVPGVGVFSVQPGETRTTEFSMVVRPL